ncbi:MAG: chromosomal replication initiator protein DnaA [Bacteroidales bacterium]|nr:chromosomal replication initiator protein DnaA [Bacteroidales bacterium]
MQKHYSVWNNCLKVIKDNVPAVSFRTWFEPIVPLSLENEILTIQVPSPFFYEYLEEKFIDLLRKTLRKELGEDAKLEYSVVVDRSNYTNTQISAGAETRGSAVTYPWAGSQKLSNKAVTPPLETPKGSFNPFVIPGIQKLNIDPQLNPDKSFDNFIEGECNRLARAAGLAVSSHPGGTAFNPLFIYSESGLGKTHIAQAIGLQVKTLYPEKIVLYITANKFQTQFTDARLKNEINNFLHFYQMIDLLIIDDVHEMAGKPGTQEIFFHIFNHLHQVGKQLIMTSDKPPVELQGLEQRLISRFKWGLSAELSVPDFKTREAILKKKAYRDGIELPDEVAAYLAQNITSNVRELEGALISLLAQSTLNRKSISMEVATEVVDKLVKNVRVELSIDYIGRIVCEHMNVPIELLHSATRKREIVQARQIAMYFSKNLTKTSLASIGQQIGGKDHATVLHACKTVTNLQETDKRFRMILQDISKKLQV